MADPVRVFISYSSQDADIVDRLKTALAQAGVDVWLDHEQLTPGTPNWQTKVREGIAQATYTIYAASETAAQSSFVFDEINIARNKGKIVIPFWIRGTDWHDCAPLGFGATQHIDGRDATFASGLAKLLESLGIAIPASATAALQKSNFTEKYLSESQKLIDEARALIEESEARQARVPPIALLRTPNMAGQWKEANDSSPWMFNIKQNGQTLTGRAEANQRPRFFSPRIKGHISGEDITIEFGVFGGEEWLFRLRLVEGKLVGTKVHSTLAAYATMSSQVGAPVTLMRH